jgi:hypothetical protein
MQQAPIYEADTVFTLSTTIATSEDDGDVCHVVERKPQELAVCAFAQITTLWLLTGGNYGQGRCAGTENALGTSVSLTLYFSVASECLSDRQSMHRRSVPTASPDEAITTRNLSVFSSPTGWPKQSSTAQPKPPHQVQFA